MKKTLMLIVIILTFMLMVSVESMASSRLVGKKLYLQANLWFHNPMKIPSIVYHKGPMLYAGTQVKILDITRRGMKFKTVKDDVTYRIIFYRKYHPGLTAEDYAKLYFGPDNPLKGATYAGFTKAEKRAIEMGELTVGMSKKAVIMAYGYPPQHMTPSTNLNVWSYWKSKFHSMEIKFDKKGTLRKITK